VTRARVYRYRVPWRNPPDPAYGPWREGFFVRIDGEGREGIGECAPLFERVPAEALIGWAAGAIESESLPYPARFAVEMALAAIEPSEREVAVAALLPRGHAVEDLSSGLRTVKVKVGADASVVGRVRDRFPDAELRVDANRAWTVVPPLDAYGVAYVEEPLRDLELLPTVELPVALDETLRERPELLAAPWLRVAVFKPELAAPRFDEARAHGKRAIVSACFPTDLGLWTLGALADRAGLRGAQGLGTLRFLDTAAIYETPLEQTADGFTLAVRPLPRWSALELLS
jgi:L-alanine-DL-glutamate epimerase-like enolase superfamily enzyme